MEDNSSIDDLATEYTENALAQVKWMIRTFTEAYQIQYFFKVYDRQPSLKEKIHDKNYDMLMCEKYNCVYEHVLEKIRTK